MATWHERAEMSGDVVFFPYVNENIEQNNTEVFVWDLDKTYLDTTIDSLSGLLQTIIERAFSKKNIPGTDTLLRGLAKYREQQNGQQYFPIYFITASPPQMEERISEKFSFDNIRPFGCFYKDNLKNIRPGRFWRLTKQVGYKLQALMQLRTRLHPEIRQICWGDDSESDAIIYNLYSDICARRLSTNDIRLTLEKLHVSGEQVDHILQLQSQIPEHDPVERIYINLATDTDPEYYFKFGRRTLATYNTFQAALDLYQNGKLDLTGVYSVAEDMIQSYGYTPEELTQSFDELIRRRVLTNKTYDACKEYFSQQGLLYSGYTPSMAPVKEDETHAHEPWVFTHVDYLNDYR